MTSVILLKPPPHGSACGQQALGPNAEGCYRSKKSDKKKSNNIAKYYLLPGGSSECALMYMGKLLM